MRFSIKSIGNLRYIEDPKREVDAGVFSKSDLAVFDEIVSRYGNWTFKQLYDHTHKHFAYKRAWDNRYTNADSMRFEDVIDERADKEEIVEDLEFVARAI